MSSLEIAVKNKKIPLLNKLEHLYNSEYGLFSQMSISKHNLLGKTMFSAVVKLQGAKDLGEDGKYAQGGGHSIISACQRALGEGIERTSARQQKHHRTLFGTYEELCEQFHLLDPNTLPRRTPAQLLPKPMKILSRQSKLAWVECKNLLNDNSIFIPAYLVYLPHQPSPEEDIVDFSTSTGLAAGSSFNMALQSALLEIVERDAFALFWLTKAKPMDISQLIESEFKQYLNLLTNIVCFDISTDLKIPTVVSFALGKNPPYLSVGAASGTSIVEAYKKSLEELGGSLYFGNQVKNEKKIQTAEEISNFKEHAKYWIHFQSQEIPLWFNEKIVKKEADLKTYSLDEIIAALAAKNFPIYYIDLTLPHFAELGLHVVRCVSPDLQPLWVRNNLAHLDSKRLHDFAKTTCFKGELNPLPHPFP